MYVILSDLSPTVVPVWFPVVWRNHFAFVTDKVATHILPHRVHALPTLVRQLVRPGWILGQQTIANARNCACELAEVWCAATVRP